MLNKDLASWAMLSHARVSCLRVELGPKSTAQVFKVWFPSFLAVPSDISTL